MSEPTELWAGRWNHIRVRHAEGVTELQMHTDGGPLVWSAGIHRELPEALFAIDMNADSKVLIITGAGDSFCNTIDLQSFYKPDLDWNEIWFEGRKMLELLVDLNIPIISIVNGPARIHAELGVLAEIVLAAPDAIFADHAHFTRDTAPGDGVHIVWPYLLGPTRGRYFLLTGAEIDAQEALRVGFVHEIHDRAQLLDRAWELARGMARMPKSTLQYTRMMLSFDLRRYFAQDLSHGLALQGQGFWARKSILHPGES